VDGTTFSLLEAFQRHAVVSGFVRPDDEQSFEPAVNALAHSELIVALERAIDESAEKNGRIHGRDIAAARTKPLLAHALSRMIVRFESHWSPHEERWAALDHLMNHDWKGERERQNKRGWWSEVASKIDTFPQDPRVHHIHPFGWTDNFITARDVCSWFETLTDIVIEHEGGFSDVEHDKGGATKYGISFATWKARALQDLGIEPTIESLRKITLTDAKTIYLNAYWHSKGHAQMSSVRFALMTYDWSITSGKSGREVRRFLQTTYGAKISEKGGWNDELASELTRISDQSKLYREISALRKNYYRALVSDDPTQEKFIKGWLNRVADCEVRPLSAGD
jgi:lysozyme family protein